MTGFLKLTLLKYYSYHLAIGVELSPIHTEKKLFQQCLSQQVNQVLDDGLVVTFHRLTSSQGEEGKRMRCVVTAYKADVNVHADIRDLQHSFRLWLHHIKLVRADVNLNADIRDLQQ